MDGEMAARHLVALRRKRPLVHAITNFVAMPVSANVLLAAGASPAMVLAPEEAAEFAARADALAINIGTLTAERAQSMLEAADAARRANVPWVLDPVAAGATRFRRQTAAALLERRPTIVRGNASEIMALAGRDFSARGTESSDTVEAAEDAARSLAASLGAVVAVTGPRDFATDGANAVRVLNGSPAARRVSGLGCALSALAAAFAAVVPDPMEATAAALAYYGLAGERAEQVSPLPGSFAVALLDALAAIEPTDLAAGARIERA